MGLRSVKRCATSPLMSEFSLCGNAFDGPSTEEDMEPFTFAEEVGESVNCEACLLILKSLFDTYTPTGRLKKN